MSHDYGKARTKKKPVRKNRKTSSRPAIPGWVLFFSGVAFTLFAQLLYHLAMVETPPVTGTDKGAANSTEPAPKKPTINFYNQLKTMEVKVPGDEDQHIIAEPVTGEKKVAEKTAPSTTATETKAATTTPATPAYSYALQAGSYKSSTDADEQRAALTLLGVNARIESTRNPDGKTYYRVMVGPFSSASALENARTTLNENNIPSITVKR